MENDVARAFEIADWVCKNVESLDATEQLEVALAYTKFSNDVRHIYEKHHKLPKSITIDFSKFE